MKQISLFIIALLFYLPGFTQVICVDAGHGYGPAGENSDGRTWEEISTNCEVALRLDTILVSKGYTVILTRTNSDTGSWLSLTQRAEIADNYESERLLSIHCNAGGGTGTESFWCYRNSPNRAIDSIFSSIVQEQMALMGEWRSRRSIEDELYLGFHLGVLKGVTPGCLNEIGFVDTPADLVKLLDNTWRYTFAEAYASAIDLSFEVDYPPIIAIEEKSEMVVFPNPFEDFIQIKSTVPLEDELLCSLFTMEGRVVKSIRLLPNKANNASLFTSDIDPGFYVFVIRNQKSTHYYKLIKW